MFEGNDIAVFAGPMVTVLGTSLQNRDLLNFPMNRLRIIDWKWRFYYQKRFNRLIRGEVFRMIKKVRYAYYASDNPLWFKALASGGLELQSKTTHLPLACHLNE
jgi:hypothetical protein